MTKAWHQRIEAGIDAGAATHGFKKIEPAEVYFRLSDDRYVLYRPDGLLVRQRRGYHVLIIEAETNPTAKVVPGDVGLASLAWSPSCEIYPYDDIEIGRRLRHDRTFRHTYDLRSTELTFEAAGRRFLSGNDIGTLGFFLIVPTVGARAYFERYLQLLISPRRGVPPLFSYSKCYAVEGKSRRSADASMRRIIGAA